MMRRKQIEVKTFADQHKIRQQKFMVLTLQRLQKKETHPNTDLQSKKTNQYKKEYFKNVQGFTFNNFGVETAVEIFGLEIICIGCLQLFKRINAHLKNSTECQQKVDINNFFNAFADFKKDEKTTKKIIYREAMSDDQKEANQINHAIRRNVCRQNEQNLKG